MIETVMTIVFLLVGTGWAVVYMLFPRVISEKVEETHPVYRGIISLVLSILSGVACAPVGIVVLTIGCVFIMPIAMWIAPEWVHEMTEWLSSVPIGGAESAQEAISVPPVK